MINLKKIGLLLLLSVLSSSVSVWATDVYYIPANYDGSAGELGRNITDNANYEPICNGRNNSPRLPGLDLVRRFAGVPDCTGRTYTTDQFEQPVDAVLLIDDTSSLSAYLREQLSEKNLLQMHNGRQVVANDVVDFTNDGEDTGMNILIVGEIDFRIAGSNQSVWWQELSNQTGNSFCELPENNQRLINDFSRQIVAMNTATSTAMQNALNSFETKIDFDSEDDAQARVGVAVLKAAANQALGFSISRLGSIGTTDSDALEAGATPRIPGVTYVIALAKAGVAVANAASAERERAAASARSRNMGVWINDTRSFISNCMGNSRCSENLDTIGLVTDDMLIEETQSEICSLTANRRQEALQNISTALTQSRENGRPRLEVFAKGFYEAWINSHLPENDRYDLRTPVGTIEVIWEVEERDGDLFFDGDSYIARVSVPQYGVNADDGMNTIMSELSGVNQPWDFKVKKAVCFMVGGVNPGGRTRVCGLLDKDNSVIHQPEDLTGMGRRAFNSDVWRNRTTRFRR